MSTNYLNINLPIVSTTLGPEYANMINTAFEVIDSHNHSSGKGVQIPTSGLNIDANLNLNTYKLYNLTSSQYTSKSSTLTGASNINSIYVTNGDLYYTNSSGTAVQITSGGSLPTTPGAVQTVETQGVAADVTINPSSTYVYMTVDTTSARQITLPLANSVSAGRIYIIKDTSGQANTNNITIAKQGSDTIDGNTSYTHDSNFGTIWLIGDGVSAWYVS